MDSLTYDDDYSRDNGSYRHHYNRGGGYGSDHGRLDHMGYSDDYILMIMINVAENPPILRLIKCNASRVRESLM